MIKSIKIHNIYTDKILLNAVVGDNDLSYKCEGGYDFVVITKDGDFTAYSYPSDKVYSVIEEEK